MAILTGYETELERSEVFRKSWEKRAKRSFKVMHLALQALEDDDIDEAIRILEAAIYG